MVLPKTFDFSAGLVENNSLLAGQWRRNGYKKTFILMSSLWTQCMKDNLYNFIISALTLTYFVIIEKAIRKILFFALKDN